MKTNKVILIANVSKSQIKDTGTHWEIKTIPVTVDDAVMNNILYPADENQRGLTSLLKKPIALSHPVDGEGNFMSAGEGEGLQDFFSGGVITNVYNVDGINYADARIKKDLLKAQDDGEWYFNALNTKSDIGVSTGLIIPQNMESGTAKDGTPYEQTAINQQYDHLAMLKPEEAPAGGDATFMRFNAQDKEDLFVVNINDHIPEKGTFKQFMDMCKAYFAGNNDNSYNQDSGHKADDINLNNGEVAKVDKKKMMELMKNMGMDMKDVENMDEDKMYNAMMDYSKNMGGKKSNMDDDDKEKMDKEEMKKNSSNSETPAWAASLITANKELTEKVNGLESQLTANAESEKEKLVDNAAEIGILSKEEAQELSVNFLKSHIAKHGGHLNVNAAGGSRFGNSNTQSLSDKCPE